jgi:nucleosome binding factor SPN SPT16 subunit
VYGFAVPFHINTIKNVSKTDEGEHTLLRINFQTPGQLAGKKEDTVCSHLYFAERSLAANLNVALRRS